MREGNRNKVCLIYNTYTVFIYLPSAKHLTERERESQTFQVSLRLDLCIVTTAVMITLAHVSNEPFETISSLAVLMEASSPGSLQSLLSSSPVYPPTICRLSVTQPTSQQVPFHWIILHRDLLLHAPRARLISIWREFRSLSLPAIYAPHRRYAMIIVIYCRSMLLNLSKRLFHSTQACILSFWRRFHALPATIAAYMWSAATIIAHTAHTCGALQFRGLCQFGRAGNYSAWISARSIMEILIILAISLRFLFVDLPCIFKLMLPCDLEADSQFSDSLFDWSASCYNNHAIAYGEHRYLIIT